MTFLSDDDFNEQLQGFYSVTSRVNKHLAEAFTNNRAAVYQYLPRHKRIKTPGYMVIANRPGKDITEDHIQIIHEAHWRDIPSEFGGNTIAALAIDPITQTCRFGCLDVDRHKKDDDPARNLEVALEIVAKLKEKGIKSLLEDSNGNGGYHIWLFFESPVPARDLHPFLADLIKPYSETKIDVFPKQKSVREKGTGNGVRPPSPHHTRKHVSQFENNGEWLKGEVGAKFFCRFVLFEGKNPPEVIPNYAAPPKVVREKKSLEDSTRLIKQLQSIASFLPSDYSEDYEYWIKMILALALAAHEDPKNEADYKEIARRISAESDKHDDEEFDRRWEDGLDRASDEIESPFTISSLFKDAIENGWVDPSKDDLYTIPDDFFKFNQLSPSHSTAVEFETFDNRPRQLPKSPTMYPRTDEGRAEMLFDRWGDKIHYCVRSKAFLYFNGTRWIEDESGEIEKMAIETFRSCASDEILKSFKDQKEAGKWKTYVRSNENQRPIKDVLNAVKKKVSINPQAFDSEAHLINTPSGVVDLKGKTLSSHHPVYKMKKVTKAFYDPSAKSEVWESFLDRVFLGDSEVISFVQRWIGYSCTAETSEEKFLICHGSGRNGKTALFEIVMQILGDYAGVMPKGLMVTGRNKLEQASEYDRATLQGKRFLQGNEFTSGDRFNEASIKEILKGEISGRNPFGKPFTFRSTFKPTCTTNPLPRTEDGGDSMAGRTILLPFKARFWDPAQGETTDDERQPIQCRSEDFKQNKELSRTLLRDHSTAIFAWMVEGAYQWYQRGLDIPASMIDGAKSYQNEQDRVMRFLNECCEVTKGECKQLIKGELYTRRETLHGAYLSWCKQEDYQHPLSLNEFKNKVTSKGIAYQKLSSRGSRPWVFVGVKIIDPCYDSDMISMKDSPDDCQLDSTGLLDRLFADSDN